MASFERPRPIGPTIAITVRLNEELYTEMKIAGVRKRLSNQVILVAALRIWLHEHGEKHARTTNDPKPTSLI
jgi:hypothetical protein